MSNEYNNGNIPHTNSTPLIHGDDYWTWDKLTNGLYASFSIFALLFCADKILDVINLRKK